MQGLNIYERMYEKIIETPLGVRFVNNVLEDYPNETGPVIRTKIQDEKNLNEFKVIDMFRREGSRTPNGTLLKHWKTGEQGEWEWTGKQGNVRLENTTVPVATLSSFRSWKIA